MRALSSARVVVLDADPDHRNLLCSALEALGLTQVLPGGSFDEVRAVDPAPDVCVVDARRLPGDQRIPRNPFDPARTPGILIVAETSSETLKLAVANGFSAVIGTPVVPRLLYRRIGSVLQKARRVGRRGSVEMTARSVAAVALQDA
jgi:DNA-binding response OmpR family regulator